MTTKSRRFFLENSLDRGALMLCLATVNRLVGFQFHSVFALAGLDVAGLGAIQA